MKLARKLDVLLPDGVDPDRLLADALRAGILAVAGLLIVLLAKHRHRAIVFVLISLGGAVVLETLLKHSFKRPPLDPNDHGYSFPSGSAAAAAAAVAALTLLARDVRTRLITAGVGALIAFVYGGLAVYAGWHYPSDIFAGWTVAVAWVSALWVAARPARAIVSARARADY